MSFFSAALYRTMYPRTYCHLDLYFQASFPCRALPLEPVTRHQGITPMIWRTCCSNAARYRASNIAAIGCSSHSKSYHYPNPSFPKKKVARKLRNNLERILPLALEAFRGTFRMRFQLDLLSLPGKLMTSIILPVANSHECVLLDLRVRDLRW